jgi:hypothetical protein
VQGQIQGRYFSGFVWLGAPWLPLMLGRRLDGRPLALLVCGLLGVLWLGYLPPAGPEPPELAQAHWLDQVLAPRVLDSGLADYAHARPLRMLSARDLALAPVVTEGGGLTPYLWSVDRKIFAWSSRPQFVVLDGLDPAALRANLGPPAEVLSGAGMTVWIYARAAPGRTLL